MYPGKTKICSRCGERCFRQNKDRVCEACTNESIPVDFSQYNYSYWQPATGIDLAERTIHAIWNGKLK